MDVLADMRAVLDRVDQLVADVLRVRGHEAHAANALHLVHHAQEVSEVCTLVVFAVRVHILPEQRHLAIALRHGALHLRNDLLRRAAALTSAHIGDDAVGAVVVAAVHDRHPRGELAAARNGQILRNLAVRERHIHNGRMLRRNLCDDAREFLYLARTEHEVDMRCAAHEVVALLLRHTARDAEDQLWVLLLDLLDLADLPIHLVLCCLAHAAGVDEDDVGICRLLCPHVARPLQLSLHALGVRDVHLTSIDKDFVSSPHSFPLTFIQ